MKQDNFHYGMICSTILCMVILQDEMRSAYEDMLPGFLEKMENLLKMNQTKKDFVLENRWVHCISSF